MASFAPGVLRLASDGQDAQGRGTILPRDVEAGTRGAIAQGRGMLTPEELHMDIHALEQDLLLFERKYGVRSETFYAAYQSGEEPEDDAWVLDFAEWAGVYRTYLARQAAYRNETG